MKRSATRSDTIGVIIFKDISFHGFPKILWKKYQDDGETANFLPHTCSYSTWQQNVWSIWVTCQWFKESIHGSVVPHFWVAFSAPDIFLLFHIWSQCFIFIIALRILNTNHATTSRDVARLHLMVGHSF